MMLTRRRLLGLLGAAVSVGGRRTWAATEKGPIRVGFIVPLTGPFAQNGKDMWDGFRLYFEQIGMKAAGREFALLVENSWVEPTAALTKLRKLVEQDRVQVAAGGLLAPTGLALQPYVLAQRIPFIVTSGADDVTQRKIIPWYIRTHYSSSQTVHPLGDYCYRTLGYRRVAGINFDFGFGHENMGGFQRVFEELGGKVVQKLWAPATTVDFAPYLAQLNRTVDAVFATFSGTPALRFIKQATEYGIKARIPIVGNGTLTDEHILPSMGDDALGIITSFNYSPALDNPANKAFLAAYRKATGRLPSGYAHMSYTAARWIVEGAKVVGGEVDDKDRYLAALKRVDLRDDPRGPVRVDQWGSPVQNMYVRRVERVAGELQNTVVHTYPNVSQFWTYRPEEFLKNPVYDRDTYPGCRYCE